MPDLVSVPLQVRGKCNMDQLTKCFSAMCKAKTLVIIEQLSITSDPKKPDELDVTMVLSTLAQGEDPPMKWLARFIEMAKSKAARVVEGVARLKAPDRAGFGPFRASGSAGAPAAGGVDPFHRSGGGGCAAQPPASAGEPGGRSLRRGPGRSGQADGQCLSRRPLLPASPAARAQNGAVSSGGSSAAAQRGGDKPPPPDKALEEQVQRISSRNIFAPPRPRKSGFGGKLVGVLGQMAFFEGSQGQTVGSNYNGATIKTIGADWVEIEYEGRVSRLNVFDPGGAGSSSPGAPMRPGPPGMAAANGPAGGPAMMCAIAMPAGMDEAQWARRWKNKCECDKPGRPAGLPQSQP